MLLVPFELALVFLFALGLSLTLSALTVYFRDMTHLHGLINLAWMYLTPIFYPISIVPERVRFLWDLNPMFHYVNLMRDLVLYGTLPSMATVLFAAGFSVVSLLVGVIVFSKLQDTFFLHI
jgi:ABC-2 type transport system permease protein